MDIKIIIQNLTIENLNIYDKNPHSNKTSKCNSNSSSISDLQKLLKKASESTDRSLANDLKSFE